MYLYPLPLPVGATVRPSNSVCRLDMRVVQQRSVTQVKSHVTATSHQSITPSEWSYHCVQHYEAGLLQHCPCNSSTICNFKSQLQSLVKRSVTSATNVCDGIPISHSESRVSSVDIWRGTLTNNQSTVSQQWRSLRNMNIISTITNRICTPIAGLNIINVAQITFLDKNRRHQMHVHSLDSTQSHNHVLRQRKSWIDRSIDRSIHPSIHPSINQSILQQSVTTGQRRHLTNLQKLQTYKKLRIYGANNSAINKAKVNWNHNMTHRTCRPVRPSCRPVASWGIMSHAKIRQVCI